MTDVTFINAARSVHDFRIGHVMGTTTSIIIRKAYYILPIAAIAALPITLMMMNILENRGENVVASVFMWMVPFLLVSSLAQAILVFTTFQIIRGRQPQPLLSVQHGLRRFPAVLGTSIAATILVVIGLVMLVIPGYIFGAMLFVSVSACVVERLGPIESLSRSKDLTKGYRWRIFGIAVIVSISDQVAMKVVEFSTIGSGNIASYLILSFIMNAVYMAYQAILPVVAYHDLRVVKEGIDIDRIAEVFD